MGCGRIERLKASLPTPSETRLLCHYWSRGKDCPHGAQCNKYCYLTKGQDMYKSTMGYPMGEDEEASGGYDADGEE
jgi:hypothetical protein